MQPNLVQLNGHELWELMADGTYKRSGKRYSERKTWNEIKETGQAVNFG